MERERVLNWDIHDQNTSITGMQGSGKTTLAKDILKSIPSTPRLIVSPQNPRKLYGEFGEPINQVRDIQDDQAMLWVGNTLQSTFDRICDQMMNCHNTLMVVDDAHEFATKQKISDEWKTLIGSGRNQGNTSIFISPAPNLMNNLLLQSSTIMYSFSFALESQIEYAKKNFFGDIAYLLMPIMARPLKYQRHPQLNHHDFLSRHTSDKFIELHTAQGITKLESLDDVPYEESNQTLDDEPTKESITHKKKENLDHSSTLEENPHTQEEPEKTLSEDSKPIGDIEDD